MPTTRLALAVLLALPAVLPRPARAETRLEIMRAVMFTDPLDGVHAFHAGGAPGPSPTPVHTAHGAAPAPVSATPSAVSLTKPAAKIHNAGRPAPVRRAPTHKTVAAPHARRAVSPHRPASAKDSALIAELRRELATRDAEIAALRAELMASRSTVSTQLAPVAKAERAPAPVTAAADPAAVALDASRLNREALQAVSAGDYRVAVEKFRRAADLNDSAALANLGTMYLNGTGVTQNANQAIQLLVQAANQGNRTAAENLGTLNEYGISGVQQNPLRAYQWYEVAARLGSTTVQTSMARIRGQN
ncbi:tetratricopeptide repeat protein [Rhodanobacter denitrificans]|uniref:tetratricopeptide repeat protein n=1 Tax=Rhodanobacter denitrificans TaxID=666685 RepID=UPI001F25D9D9|nr:tetratricopeptide repeat protein [Rhodanobacter denitrificans]UJJ60416.1 hypothetical protein LRK55_18425 [Rhodanobacter denitrificans]